jgi:hypothetical protein
VDRDRVDFLRDVLAATGWVERTRDFASSLRRARRGASPGSLLVVGTPTDEPWHLTAHLDDEARWFDLPELTPTLVRWAPPPDAPAHLATDLSRLESARRGETVMVVAPDDPTAPLLERVADARKDGAVVLAIDGGGGDLESLAHELLVVPPDADQPLVAGVSGPPPVSFDVVTHLVSMSAGTALDDNTRVGLRERLGRFLDNMTGHKT